MLAFPSFLQKISPKSEKVLSQQVKFPGDFLQKPYKDAVLEV